MAFALTSLFLIDLLPTVFLGPFPLLFHGFCIWLYFIFKSIRPKRWRFVLMSIPVIFGIIGFTSIYLMIEAAKIITTDTDTSNVLDLKLRTAQSLTGARLVMFIVVAPIAMLTERGWAYIRKDHVGPDG